MGDSSLENISSVERLPAVPPQVDGINVNFCKNPACANFGVPADIVKYARRKGTELATTPGKAYQLLSKAKNRPSLKCLLCGEIFSVKSNRAIAEELSRFNQALSLPAATCPNDQCRNHRVPIDTPEAYYRFGTTNAGSPRYRCRACQRTFTVGGRALRRQRITHANKTILMALTNKMPMRRIIKVTGISAPVLYGKIDFLRRQCLAFAADRERALRQLEKPRLYISVDRQDYTVNWDRDTDRRNIVIKGLASADNDSGYIFGTHLNFDEGMSSQELEDAAEALGDAQKPYPHRHFARLWLQADYQASLEEANAERERQRKKAAKQLIGRSLSDRITDAYEAASIRQDTEVSDIQNEDQKLPNRQGVQVHEEYTLYGHFYFLKELLPNVEKLRFYLDQDSGMRAACLAPFAQDILSKRVDAFYVRISKDMTVEAKRALVGNAQRAFKRRLRQLPDLSDKEVEVLMMHEAISRARNFGPWQDRWAAHPLPKMSEPDKAMCWLTDLRKEEPDYDPDHLARLFLKASLHSVDNFFQRVRRSVNLLERPIHTASRNRRTWYGYSPYNPVMVGKLLDIYRVMHNFVEAGKDGKTPAMRLGLAKGLVSPEDIIYFAVTKSISQT